MPQIDEMEGVPEEPGWYWMTNENFDNWIMVSFNGEYAVDPGEEHHYTLIGDNRFSEKIEPPE